ncbi:S41 family peptidase [Sphingomonas sp. NBWT7]|uniref:S41 family peptidase n=1 Tax=Sphingomonas sp. NBWT7 TaxID=2596913 RepID=UPI00215617FD|nr:S41 family peptidase [Sphingomonas sp. NBWT7]
MSRIRKVSAGLCVAALLAGCGGDGGSGGASSGGTAVAPAPSPTPTATAACSLRARQDWAAAQLREWYLFPETLPTSFDPGGATTLQAYVDTLTATARAQSKDRFFTYVTSIAEENAYYSSGSSAGYGVRLAVDAAAQRLFVSEAFEGAPALAAGIDRGTEILAIGTSAGDLRTVASLIQAGGSALTDAFGPPDAGVARVFRVRAPDGTQSDVTVAQRDYALLPVSSRYGIRIIEDGGRRVGYVNLRTFISTADQALRDGFAQFRAAGVTEVIVDLRYNGGGLVATAELFGDLLGGGRSTNDVFSYTTFRPEKAAENRTDFFTPQPQSIAATRIAFIGTGASASASELVINAFTPYLHTNAALIGTNTYGKPVGQIARDLAACDDRLRLVAFATQNAARQGAYYTGLAPVVEATCQASDDLAYPLGDVREASVRQALDFLAGRACTPIGGARPSASAARTSDVAVRREALTPPRPTTIQRETPGAF